MTAHANAADAAVSPGLGPLATQRGGFGQLLVPILFLSGIAILNRFTSGS